MTKLTWDQTGERLYETGVNKGVLYMPDNAGLYNDGVAWNGLTTVTESPSGAEATAIYADNIKYLNLISAEEFGATIEAYTYPEEFGQFDGTVSPSPGISVGQQNRKAFGLSYQTRVGNDVEGSDYGYKLHLIYNATAAPSEKAYATINDSPEAITFSWELTTTPVDAGEDLKPTAQLTIDSNKVDPGALSDLEDLLYGTAGQDARLPLPVEVISLFTGTVTEVETSAPTYNASTDIVTIPTVTGVIYSVDGNDVAPGPFGPITEDVVVAARPAAGYKFTDTSDDDWSINFS
jgi:hypothetical protein